MSSLEAPYRCTWTDCPRNTKSPSCPTTGTRWFSKTDHACSIKLQVSERKVALGAEKELRFCTVLRLLLGVTRKDWLPCLPPSQKPTPCATTCLSPPPEASTCSTTCGPQPKEQGHRRPSSLAGGATSSTLPTPRVTSTRSTGTAN